MKNRKKIVSIMAGIMAAIMLLSLLLTLIPVPARQLLPVRSKSRSNS